MAQQRQKERNNTKMAKKVEPQITTETKVIDGREVVVKVTTYPFNPEKIHRVGIGKVRYAEGSNIARERK